MTFTIKSRLILLITLMLFLLAGTGLTGLAGMNSVNRTADLLYHESLQGAQQLATLNELVRETIQELSLSSQHDPALPVSALHDHPIQLHLTNVEGNLARIDTLWASLINRERSTEATALAELFDQQYQRLVDNGIRPALQRFADNDFNTANEIVFVEAMTPFRILVSTLQALIAQQDYEAAASYQEAVDRAHQLRTLVIATVIVGILLGSVLGWLLMQRILQPLARTRHHLQQMAEGNLADDIQADGRDEVGEILLVLADSRDKIRGLIIDIQSSAESISTASTQIATGNNDLAQRTELQASSLQETAASMEQVAATVKNNTDHTSQANQLAQVASRSADTGGQRAREAIERMHEMARSSEEISSIISLINGIAFQTNILALNASVEAARAGEQGRGFAVVAGEVRSLAQRSADAAKQIQALIDHNSNVVQAGSELVESVGLTIEEIVENISRVSTLMEEVNRASNEQTMATEQVNVAISQMDEVTQQNAALVEQTATASASLEDQARDLANAVRFFRVGMTHEANSTSSEPPATPALRPQRQAKSDTPAPPGKLAQLTTSRHEEADWESF